MNLNVSIELIDYSSLPLIKLKQINSNQISIAYRRKKEKNHGFPKYQKLIPQNLFFLLGAFSTMVSTTAYFHGN